MVAKKTESNAEKEVRSRSRRNRSARYRRESGSTAHRRSGNAEDGAEGSQGVGSREISQGVDVNRSVIGVESVGEVEKLAQNAVRKARETVNIIVTDETSKVEVNRLKVKRRYREEEPGRAQSDIPELREEGLATQDKAVDTTSNTIPVHS